MKKNAFLTFLFACIPGAGQMYYGYMRRGLSLIVMCCVAAGVGSILPPIMLAVPVIWMYAFFDTYDLIRYMAAGTPNHNADLPPYPGAGHDHTHNDFPDDFPPA